MKKAPRITAAWVAALTLATLATHAATYYVSPGGNDAANGTSWATARRTIQAAINLAVNTGDEVVVTNGTYGVIKTNNRLITVRSVNGASVTIIDGGGTAPCASLSFNQGVLSSTNTVLTGFTLRNGRDNLGGGAHLGTLNNCTLANNTATDRGGGAYYSTLNNCTLTGNTAIRDSGGGAYYSTLNNCTLTGNTATGDGGGAMGSTLNDCTLTGNSANNGGGARGGTLNNCILSGNSATRYGGGAYDSFLNDCTLTGNSANNGGGVYNLNSYILNNCILTDNTANGDGGGAWLLYGTLNNCTLTGNSANNSGGSSGGTLNSCILSNNMASALGGGSSAGTLNNCTLSGNTASSGGGSNGGTLNSCILSNNMASALGGGSNAGTLNNCLLTGNTANGNGGGSNAGTLNNCTLSGNTASSGGGSNGGTLNNCIVWGNFISGTGTTTNYDGGTFRYSCAWPLPGGNGNIGQAPLFVDAANGNFRLRQNSPGVNAGDNTYATWSFDLDGKPRIQENRVDMGAYESSLVFSLGEAVNAPALGWQTGGNKPWFGYSGHPSADGLHAARSGSVGDFESSWIETAVTGPGALSFWWKVSSEAGYDCLICTTNGTEAMRISGEVDWEPRVLEITAGGTVVCWTYIKDKAWSEGLDCGWLDDVTWWADGLPVTMVTLDGNGGAPASQALAQSLGSLYVLPPAAPTRAGSIFTGWFTAPSGGTQVTAATKVMQLAAHTLYAQWIPVTVYVDASRPNDTGDGQSWAAAKKSIQAAINAVVEGGTVIVTNGTYTPISTANKAITIRSVNGASVTIIDGGGTARCATLGFAQIGMESMTTNTVLSGFTLTNGDGGSHFGTLNNCTLTNNTATSRGGGSYYGTLNNCTLTGNTASSYYGGGSYYGTLNNCTLTGNTATREGGGSYGSTLNNCTLTGNSANNGGGSSGGTLNSCILTGNTANNGGGSCIGTLNNCTLTGNTASSGGGSYSSTLNNCIIWGNFITGTGSVTNYNGGTFRYSCTWPMPDGSNPGNIDADPMFVDAANGDFRLKAGSPCINAGTNVWFTSSTAASPIPENAVDLDGNFRIHNGRVDMGAYEFGSSPPQTQTHTTTTGVPVPYTWLDDYLNWKGITDYEALALLPGENGLFFWESYVAGLNPTNVNSKFVITNFVVSAQSRVTALDWSPHLSNRAYTVYGKTNLMDTTPWHTPTNSGTRFFKVEVKLLP